VRWIGALLLLAGCRQILGIEALTAGEDEIDGPPGVADAPVGGADAPVSGADAATVDGELSDGASTCPESYAAIGPKCYRLSATATDWGTQEAGCLGEGAGLAKIEGVVENANLVSLVMSGGATIAWIGLHFNPAVGEWTWSDGSTADYEAWAAGEENQGGSEGYGYLAESGLWYSSTALVDYRAICERDPL
jgi:hypothetical protein